MIAFFYILSCFTAFIPYLFYYLTKDSRLKWYSKVFCDNCGLFLLAFIIYILGKESKRFIFKKANTLGFEFWIITILTSNIDCTSMYFYKYSLFEEMLILNLIPVFWIIGRLIFVIYKFYHKKRYLDEYSGNNK